MYPHFRFIWEFHEWMKKTGRGVLSEEESESDLQIKKTMDDIAKNKKLFEFDCLLMGVDYDGFHSPFNHGACNKSPEDQAAYIKKVVEHHKLCAKNTQAGRKAMLEYWETHAGPIIVERQLLEWRCDEFAQHRRQPTTLQIQLKQAALERELVVEAPPSACHERMRAMHEAVAEKLPEMLDEIAATGAVTKAQTLSGAPSHQLPVEDIFQFSRQEHDRCCVQRVGIIEAKRRILKAPRLGTKRGLPHRYTISAPPPFYRPWLRKCLKQRARDTIQNEWPSQYERAKQRWEAVCEEADLAGERQEQHAQRSAATQAKANELEGGDVVLDDADEVSPLPAGERLTLELLRNINFRAEASRRQKGNGWTAEVVRNQLRLWNLHRGEWTELESEMFCKAGLIGSKAGVFTQSGSKEAIVKRLRLILVTQSAAKKRQKVLDTALRQLEQEQEDEWQEQEQQDSAQHRRSRRGRGQNPKYT